MDEGQCVARYSGYAQWDRKEQGSSQFYGHLSDQLLLKYSVQFTSAVIRDSYSLLGPGPGEIADIGQHCLSVPLICYDHTAGTFMNCSFLCPGPTLEPAFQQVSLSKRHRTLPQSYTHPVSALMYDSSFHADKFLHWKREPLLTPLTFTVMPPDPLSGSQLPFPPWQHLYPWHRPRYRRHSPGQT